MKSIKKKVKQYAHLCVLKNISSNIKVSHLQWLQIFLKIWQLILIFPFLCVFLILQKLPFFGNFFTHHNKKLFILKSCQQKAYHYLTPLESDRTLPLKPPSNRVVARILVCPAHSYSSKTSWPLASSMSSTALPSFCR